MIMETVATNDQPTTTLTTSPTATAEKKTNNERWLEGLDRIQLIALDRLTRV